MREALAYRWPLQSIVDRIKSFAHDIGWSYTRSRDIYYADARVSLRAFEQDELNNWFDLQKEKAA